MNFSQFCFAFFTLACLCSVGLLEKPSYHWGGCVIWQPEEPKAERQPLSLTKVAVHADVHGWTVGVTAELHYSNIETNETIEAEFVFPISDKAAVYHLEADIDGRKLTAQVKDRTNAEKEYKEAVASGKKAVMMENQLGSPDVYRLRLGNLPSKATAIVKVSYVQPIDRILDDGLLSFSLPVVLNPRYIPAHQLNDSEVLDSKFHKDTPYVAVSEVRYQMTFEADIDLGSTTQIADVRAGHSNDTINVEYGEGKKNAHVELTGDFVQDHDFQLLIEPMTKFTAKQAIYIEPGIAVKDKLAEKSWLNLDVAAVWFEPPQRKETAKKSKDEYWLVLDRSGSMWGDKIENAKSALGLFVKSLPIGCKFNILGFGSRYKVFFKNGSLQYDETTMGQAVAHSRSVAADLGGTEILEPLKYIYKQSLWDVPGSRRFIILLTDGEVFNTNEVIALAKKHARTTKVFSIGIGEGASTALVDGVARVSNGLAEYVKGKNDRLQAKVISVLKATTEPSATNVDFKWKVTSGGEVDTIIPKKLQWTAVYAGGSASQYATIDRKPGSAVGGYSQFSADLGGERTVSQVGFRIEADEYSKADDTMPLHRLAAKKLLEELTDEYNSNKKEETKSQIIAISMATGVLSDLTAFVAVDSEEPAGNATGPPRFVAVERPTTYVVKGQTTFGGFYGGSPPSRSRPGMGMAHLARRPMGGGFGGLQGPSPGMAMGHSMAVGYGGLVAFPGLSGPGQSSVTNMGSMGGMGSKPAVVAPPLESASSKTKLGDLFEVILAQNFNGSWTLDKKLLRDLQISVDNAADLRSAFRSVLDDTYKPDDHFVATVTTLSWLRNRFAARKSEWQLIEKKGLVYLGSTAYPGDIDALISDIATELRF